MDRPESRTSATRGEWVRQLGMFGVLALLTGIVTVLFSYVGTICVAVLAGMMIGTLPRSIWLALRVSFIFPAIMVAMLQLWRVELEFPRQLMMGGLSYAMFWAVYLLTLLVMCLEAKPGHAGEGGGGDLAGKGIGGEETSRRAEQGEEEASGSRDRLADPPGIPITLKTLAGEWHCEVPGPEGRRVQKTLRVVGDQFSLAITPVNGEQAKAVSGHLKVEGSACPGSVTLHADAKDWQYDQPDAKRDVRLG